MVRFFGKIKTTIQNNRQFFKDACLNMFAFTIYIVAQQFVLLPQLAKLLNENSYANIIMYITIMNMFCNVFGGQMGVAHQLQKSLYAGDLEAEKKDFSLLMTASSGLIMIFISFLLCYLRFDVWSIVFLVATAVISNFRLYIKYYFRINSEYKHIIIQNLLYLFGIVIGIIVYQYKKTIWAPLFGGEILALLYTLLITPKESVKFGKSKLFKITANRYMGLGVADALTNMVAVIDKILVYPLLGAYALAVYNAGMTTGKAANLLTNPLNEVILVRLSQAKEKGVSSLLKVIVAISLIGTFLLCVVIIPVIYGLSYLLYRQYLHDIQNIIVFLGLGCSVGIITSIIKSFVLCCASPKELVASYVISVVCLSCGGFIGAFFDGLTGFSIAMVLGRIILLVSFILVLIKKTKIGRQDYGESAR